MQAADHVKFGGAFADALFGALPDLFEREGVGAGRVGVAAEGAELAMRHADVGRIDVPVDVEVADVAVALLANVIGEPAEREQVGRAIERDAVVEAEPLAGHHFGGDGLRAARRRLPEQSLSLPYLRHAHASPHHRSLTQRSPTVRAQRATATAAPQKSRNSRLI